MSGEGRAGEGKVLPWLAVLGVAACSADLELSEAAQVACSESVCPPGLVCRPEIGRCVRVDGLDTEAPRLDGEPRLPAEPLSVGVSVEITLSVSEPLAGDPQVTVAGRPFAVHTRDELTWTLGYTTAGDEPEGEAPVSATLVDTAGNLAEGLACGTLTFDFTAPQVVPGTVSISPTVVGSTGTVRISLSLDEPASDLAVAVGGQPATRLEGAEDSGAPSFEYAVAGDETEGEAVVVASLVDVADRELPVLEELSAPPFFVAAHEPNGAEPRSSPASPEGQLVEAETADAAGNPARLTLGTLRFDYEPPEVVWDEAARARVRYVRDPWGSDANHYEPRMSVEVDGAAFEERGEVRVWTVTDQAAPGADPAGARYGRAELGSAVFVPGEDLTVEAGVLDSPVVHVSLTDLAGNESDADPARAGPQPLPVSLVEWVGTLNRKQVGDSLTNPHEMRYGYTLADDSQLALDVESWPLDRQAPYSGAAKIGRGEPARATAGQAPWQHAAALSPLRSRRDPGLVWDAARARLVLFGGAQTTGDRLPLADTWEWDGRRWTERTPRTSPPATTIPSLFAERSGGVLLLGDTADQIWRWDGQRWRRLPAEGAPTSVHSYGATYDPRRGVLVLFGGSGGNYHLAGDTWEWSDGRWVERPTDVAPSSRIWPNMAYDPLREEVVLFGGTRTFAICERGQSFCSDTWLWDGVGWSRVETDPTPPARYGAGVAFDAGRGVVTITGGQASSATFDFLDDTWDWDGQRWTRRESLLPAPPRSRGTMAWDAGWSRLVVGSGQTLRLDPGLHPWDDRSAWEWDDDSWVRAESVVLPGRTAPAATYDPVREEVVLFGGIIDPDDPLRRDTWRWGGRRWTELEPPDPIPTGRAWAALAPDPVSGHLILFGGCAAGLPGTTMLHRCADVLDDTWGWDGTRWQAAGGGDPPAARFGHALATAPGARGVLLFGGSDGERDENVLGDTALWDGARWRALAPEHAPPARLLHAMAWDAGRDVVVLFGGALAYGADPGLPQEDAFADTWEWDGEDWRELEPRTVPPARVGHRLVYDASRARVVLLGTAIEADTDYAVTWEWDGVDWTERQQEVSPTPRLGAAVAYDAARGEVVASSGTGECPWGVGPVGHCGTIWSYAPGRARPHLVTTFDLRASHTLEPTGRDRSGRTLLETAIRTRAGGIGHGWGTGRADGAPAPGYEVAVAAFGWGGWVPVHESNQATPAQPEDWTGEFDRAWRCGEPHCEAADITRWSDLDGRLHLDVAARSPRGAAASDGGVALDYVELRLSYWRTGCESPSERLPAGTPDDTPCSDGLPETAGERCLAGECTVP